METRDMISASFLILVSVGTCVMAYQLGLGTASSPGAGFASFGIAFVLGVMSGGMFLKALVKSTREGNWAQGTSGILKIKPMLILVTLTGYAIFFNSLGFPLCTFILMILLVWVFGRQRLHLALTVSVLTVASSYLLFVMLLGLPLPMGSFWDLLGR
ncbi:MAG: tripartite tricarboxylate transporter TctB family protein [Thermodesulfobacteriota bacterium]